MVPPVKPIFSRVLNRLKNFTSDRLRDQFSRPTTVIEPTTYDVVYPQEVSQENPVPDYIYAPPYATGELEDVPLTPILKNTDEINLITTSCRLARRMLNAAGKQIKVGMTTDELDRYIHDLIIKHRAYPSPLRYNDFPKSICTSVNNIACHGIPDNRPLANGDIVTVDITVYHQGYHGDCATTFLVGDVDEEGQYLVEKAEEIVMKTISVLKPGKDLDFIGRVITSLASKAQLTVIPSVFGHGIGRYFHEMPCINHFVEAETFELGYLQGTEIIDTEADNSDQIIEPGMIFTIEPVFSTGSKETELLEDGWTLATVDNSRTAQFEHTILITETGVEILTQ